MFLKVWDLRVYQKLCDLHLEICDLTRSWPVEEKYELASQVRKSSNSSPAQLAEKHGSRYLRSRLNGVNGSREEAAETVHHLYIGRRKRYITVTQFDALNEQYEDCMRMLAGLERQYELQLPRDERRWADWEK